MSEPVSVRREPTIIPTYEPAVPDRNPMFLEKRVYQGSSGRVYPLPVIDRIAETPIDKAWDAITLENGLVLVMALPEIGGRIHLGQDLTNGYDFFYRQNTMKPALVGLAGPWASGGVEFNWPQHHRPSTYMPTDVNVEHGDDGSITVWMSEHEPMNRMKGMHGVCLHPGRSVVELKVRLYNRTPYTQTFLWWTNIATRVHQGYQSFFPPDVHTVADHAKRATSQYPLCQDHYYGVDYGNRGRHGIPTDERPSDFIPAHSGGESPDYAPNDLSWYANIPVPTSYMAMGSKQDFVGGYDNFAQAGLIHVADHHIAPGKKQWTWGNHEFGYSWDRNLTDDGGPYIELMAGVYTDNQPDFSFIAPGETKTFSQYWYPYRNIGPVQFANLEAAISVVAQGETTKIGIAVTRGQTQAKVEVIQAGRSLKALTLDLSPENPATFEVPAVGPVLVVLSNCEGEELARYENSPAVKAQVSPPATEPPMPADVASADELYLIGLHLDQYRHATRDPFLYWTEAVRRDPGDMRCNNALGLWHFRRGEFDKAERHFQTSIDRSITRNPNPYDGEPYYNLGQTLRFLGRDTEAIDAFAKAVWNSAWQAPGHHGLAELACKRQDWPKALDHLNRSLRKDADNFRAADLKAIVLRKLGRTVEAEALLTETIKTDPCDFWARHLKGEKLVCDNGVRVDLAIDMTRAGLIAEALEILSEANHQASDGTAPMLRYYAAHLSKEPPIQAEERSDYCFPSRLEDIAVLHHAIATNPEDALAPFALGNLLYDRRRHREAIECWQLSAQVDPSNSVVLRNLGIGAFNVEGDAEGAKAYYDAAVMAAPQDARLRYERDQLWKRLGIAPEIRLTELEPHQQLVRLRDDLTLEYCALLNAVGRSEEAADILASRKFQPWEGGEGQALGAFTRTHLILGQKQLDAGNPAEAANHFVQTLNPPHNLGEARHLLANASEIWLLLGDAQAALKEIDQARPYWTRAAEFKGDFQEMSVRLFSELTLYQAIALRRLGRDAEADQMLENLHSYASELLATPAKIDYFATSLPTMLLFNDDLQLRQDNSARLMLAQAAFGLGRFSEAATQIEKLDPHAPAVAQLLSELKLVST